MSPRRCSAPKEDTKNNRCSLDLREAVAGVHYEKNGVTIHLLPALPDAWPHGKVTGLRAHGGHHVDIEWRDGKVTKYRIRSKAPGQVAVRVNGGKKTVRSESL